MKDRVAASIEAERPASLHRGRHVGTGMRCEASAARFVCGAGDAADGSAAGVEDKRRKRAAGYRAELPSIHHAVQTSDFRLQTLLMPANRGIRLRVAHRDV